MINENQIPPLAPIHTYLSSSWATERNISILKSNLCDFLFFFPLQFIKMDHAFQSTWRTINHRSQFKAQNQPKNQLHFFKWTHATQTNTLNTNKTKQTHRNSQINLWINFTFVIVISNAQKIWTSIDVTNAPKRYYFEQYTSPKRTKWHSIAFYHGKVCF